MGEMLKERRGFFQAIGEALGLVSPAVKTAVEPPDDSPFATRSPHYDKSGIHCDPALLGDGTPQTRLQLMARICIEEREKRREYVKFCRKRIEKYHEEVAAHLCKAEPPGAAWLEMPREDYGEFPLSKGCGETEFDPEDEKDEANLAIYRAAYPNMRVVFRESGLDEERIYARLDAQRSSRCGPEELSVGIFRKILTPEMTGAENGWEVGQPSRNYTAEVIFPDGRVFEKTYFWWCCPRGGVEYADAPPEAYMPRVDEIKSDVLMNRFSDSAWQEVPAMTLAEGLNAHLDQYRVAASWDELNGRVALGTQREIVEVEEVPGSWKDGEVGVRIYYEGCVYERKYETDWSHGQGKWIGEQQAERDFLSEIHGGGLKTFKCIEIHGQPVRNDQ